MATSINALEIPVSTVQSATAASYTVPADRYAIVRGQVKGGGTLSIAGVVVLGSDTWNVISNNNGFLRTPGSGGGSAGGNTVINAHVLTAGASSSAANTGVGGSTTVNNTAQYNWSAVDVYTNSTARTSDVGTFKVPPGTVIVGAGDARYHIELYRVPGSAT